MKLSIAVLLIVFGAAVANAQKANAQKKDPILVGSHSNKHPASTARSLGPGTVAAALSRKSTTASDLAKIERGPANRPTGSKPATTHTPGSKNFGVGQENKNKRMNASKPGGGTRQAVHPKTKVG